MRILLPVDGSIHSKNAIRFVASRKALTAGSPTVELLNVQYLVPDLVTNMMGLEAIKAYYQAEGDKVFAELRDVIAETGLDAKEVVISGDFGPAIAKEAERMNADLIIMGTRGCTPMSGFLLGSVSSKVLAHSKCPLLLVRDKTQPVGERLRVGICVDNSEYGRAAAEFVADNSDFFGRNTDITVINVVPYSSRLVASDTVDMPVTLISEDEAREAEDKAFAAAVEPVSAILTDAGLRPDIVRLRGKPSEAICRYAEKNLDLIIMGSHGYGNFKAAVMGSTATHIAAGCSLPLLVIRA